MISYPLPKDVRFLPCGVSFEAVFNAINPGRYTFQERGKLIVPLEVNTVYFIDNMQVSGSIQHEDYLTDVEIMPELVLRLQSTNEIVYPRKIQLLMYSESAPLTCFVHNDREKENLIVDIDGQLVQSFNTVGVNEITLNVRFSIYAIDEQVWNANFRDTTLKSFSDRIRG